MKSAEILIAVFALVFSGAGFLHLRHILRRRKMEKDHGPWWF